jgi:hypothetical protein
MLTRHTLVFVLSLFITLTQVRVFDLDTFAASLLDGHGDTVLALDVSSNG